MTVYDDRSGHYTGDTVGAWTDAALNERSCESGIHQSSSILYRRLSHSTAGSTDLDGAKLVRYPPCGPHYAAAATTGGGKQASSGIGGKG